METILVILFFAAAVWYLYRRFKRAFDPNQPGCGCSGCGNGSCSSSNTGIKPIEPGQDQVDK